MRGTHRLLIALLLGIISGGALLTVAHPVIAGLAGLVVMGAVFVASAWIELLPMDPSQTRSMSQSEDANATLEEATVIGAALASLGGLIALFIHNPKGADAIVGACLALVALACSWLMLHTMYAVRYARVYGSEGGLDFHGSDPAFSDFFYFSFTIGMSFAVSDVDVSSSPLRRIIFRHALVSYVFATVILAATINLVVTIIA